MDPQNEETPGRGYPGEHLDNPDFSQEEKQELTPLKLQPRRDNVIIKLLSAPEKTPGGIIIPRTANSSKCEGVVMAVGPGKRAFCANTGQWIEDPIDLERGNLVVFAGEYAGNPVVVDGEELYVLKEDYVFASRLQ